MTLARKRRRRRVDWQVMRRIEEEALAPVPLAGTAVHDKLVEEFPDTYPSLRTTQLLLNEWRATDGEERAWTLSDGDPEDAALVLPVIAALTRRDKESRGVSQQIAMWLVRVRTVAPDMPPLQAFNVAAYYSHAERTGGDTGFIDTYLSLEAWRSREAEEQAIIGHLLPVNWSWIGPGFVPVWGRARTEEDTP